VDSLISANPKNPYPYLLKATVLTTRSEDYEDQLDFPELTVACGNVEKLCGEYFSEPDSSDLYHFYNGMSLMYRAFIGRTQRKWIKSIRYLLKGGDHFKKTFELNPANWDVYYCLGMFEYEKSKHAGILRKLGIVSDNRKEGIAQLHISAEKGSLTRMSARHSLAWIEMENKNYENAIRMELQLLKEHPESRPFRWLLGKTYLKSQQWQKAIAPFTYILAQNRADSRNNHLNELSCLHYLIQAYEGLENWEKIIELSDEAFKLKLNKYVFSRMEDDLDNIRRIRKIARRNLKK